jgi:predicted lipoprotein with Yx(FWY)xxD motif
MNRAFFASAFVLVYAAGCAARSESSGVQEAALSEGITQIVDTSAGKVLANAEGLSLYTFDNDTTTESTCYDACATAWPALLVSPHAAPPAAPFGLTTRTDGSNQVTFNGHPLYRFRRDAAKGDINGDGLGGVWHLARPEKQGDVQVVETVAGKVLANAQGLSLYTFDNDTTTESTCYNRCAATWPALIASDPKAITTPFGLTIRTDGAKQITLDGNPLYTFAHDAAPGDINGDGLGGVWHLARPAAE